jgi:enoyl-CoA hydratase
MRDRLMTEGKAIVRGLLNLPVPVIAALQGPAIGLGATVIGCCDIVVGWKGAKIADPHVVLGLVAGDGGVLAWSQAVGIMRAKRHLLTGDAITAAEAHAIGLVSDLVETPDEALPVALALAARIATLPRGGIRGTKQAFGQFSQALYGAALDNSFAAEMETLARVEVLDCIQRILAGRKGARP